MTLFLIVFITTFCIGTKTALINSSIQPSSCPQNMISLFGQCHKQKIHCREYKSLSQCQNCQDGYLLANNVCELDTSKFLMVFPTNSLKITLSTRKEQSKVFKKLKSDEELNFKKITGFIQAQYPNMSSTEDQIDLKDVLKTPFETYFFFTWNNKLNATFLFEFSIDSKDKLTQLMAERFDAFLQNSLFTTINVKLVQKYALRLKQTTLGRIVSVSKNLYKLHYYSDFGVLCIAFVQKIPFLEIRPLETVAYQLSQFQIIDFVYSQIPILAKQVSFNMTERANYKTNQYEIKFTSESKVIVQEFQRQKQRIIFFYRQENKSIETNMKLVGGYQIFKDNQDSILRKVLNHLFQEFKFLKSSMVSKIEYQIVAGTNFLVHLKDQNNKDEYVCKLFYSLSGEIQILQIYMNSVLIHIQPLSPVQVDLAYDHRKDPIFVKLNSYLNQAQQIQKNDQILYVNNQNMSNEVESFNEYQVVYEKNSFLIARYFTSGPRLNTIQLVDYIQNGDNIFDQKQNIQTNLRIRQFLSSDKRWLNPVLIEYMKQTKPNQYLCKIVTQYGSYFYKVIEKELNEFQIYYYELIDQTENCITHSIEQIQQFELAQKTFLSNLRKNYKIQETSYLASFSAGILGSQLKYRLLFVNSQNNKKVQFFLGRQIDQSLFVISFKAENDGFRLMNTELYKKTVEKASLTQIDSLQGAKSVFGMVNQQKIKTYFLKGASKQIVYEVQFDLNLQKGSLKRYLEQQASKTCRTLDKSGNCSECKSNETALLSNCYQKIKGCLTQFGNFCLMCSGQYTLLNNKCINECNLLLA